MAEVAISLPFMIDSYGKVNSTTDQSKMWQDRVLSVIGTAIRERVMRQGFGTEIPYTVFETSEEAATTIEREVEHAFNEQLPLLRLQEVTTLNDDYTNMLNVTIIYATPNQKQVTTTIGLVSILGNTPTAQENL